MPHLNIPEDTFERLATKAAALNIAVDALAKPAFDQNKKTGKSAFMWQQSGLPPFCCLSIKRYVPNRVRHKICACSCPG